MNWYLKALSNYVGFTGRANRSEYWFFTLFNVLFSLALLFGDIAIGTFDEQSGAGVLSSLYGLAVLLPGLAVTTRRLHDTNKTGWYLLLGLIPCIGAIILLVFLVQEGTAGPNDYGSDPNR